MYISYYCSPLGDMLLAADDIGLTGIWFVGQKYFAPNLPKDVEEKETDILKEAIRWLDLYFAGKKPDFMPPLHPEGTAFRKQVWKALLTIPYGETRTYGELAKIIAKEKQVPIMSAQAIGGAVGHNPISIIIPCHRVVGAKGKLTGYAGGIEKKAFLLEMEKKGSVAMDWREKQWMINVHFKVL